MFPVFLWPFFSFVYDQVFVFVFFWALIMFVCLGYFQAGWVMMAVALCPIFKQAMQVLLKKRKGGSYS